MPRTNKLIINLISGLLFSLTCLHLQASSLDTLLIRGGNNYPPFEFINENGEPDGFNVELIKALMKELDYNYDLQLDNWNNVIANINNKRIDIVIGMTNSQDTTENILYSLPTCIVNHNFVTRKDENYASVKDLIGKDIVVEPRSLEQAGNISDKITTSKDITQSLLELSKGQYDAVMTSERFALYTTKKHKINNLSIGKWGIRPQNYSLAINADNHKLQEEINISLQHLKASGEYDKLYNKWLGIHEQKETNKIIAVLFISFIAIAIVLVLFVWLLRLQIAKATRMLNYSKQEVGIAIDAGKISAWSYNVNDQIIKPLHGHPIDLEGPDHIDNIYKIIHPEDLDIFKTALDALSNGTEQTMKVLIRIKPNDSKQYGYFETKMVRVEATKEAPLRIVGTLKEITEEVEMRQKLEDFRIKSEFIVKTNDIVLLEYNSIEHIFIRINDDNDSQKQITYTIDEYLKIVHPDDIETVKKFINQLDQAKSQTIDSEYRIIAANGNYNWYTVNTVAYKYDKKGNIIGYIGLRRNNTKWKEITNDLIVLREKADASNRLKSAFLANMSHEIRTPLNAIVGFSELIIDSQDEEEKRTFIEIIKTNNELLLQLINDVLDLSRIEAGYINFSCSTFDFSSYFDELVTSLKIKETPNVKLIKLNHYPSCEIYSDKNRIAQVITNFVTNAFKFTKSGSITLEYLYTNEGIRVMVKDTGIGIAEENKARVFERFEKLNDFAQGTGLGLSICKVIIESLQGQIGVESELGVGSTFWFWLPCHAIIDINEIRIDDTRSETQDTHILLLNEPEVRDDRKTILVAEDIDVNFIMVNTLLGDSYNIVRAINGKEAVDKAKTYKPDIILMDMKMPIMDGLDATKEIRSFNPNVPIIALTAYVFDTNRQDAIDAGCNDYLTKPINKEILRGKIDNLL